MQEVVEDLRFFIAHLEVHEANFDQAVAFVLRFANDELGLAIGLLARDDPDGASAQIDASLAGRITTWTWSAGVPAAS